MQRRDAQIRKDVVDMLYWDSRVDPVSVNVDVEDGSVILGGTVPSHYAKIVAGEDALRVAGVREVRNKAAVVPPASVVPPTDEELRVQVEELLRRDPNLHIADLSVETKLGTVSLYGTVDGVWKKTRAEWLLSNLTGVVNVENKLAVVPTYRFLDKEIARDIVTALERDVLVNAGGVNVRVESGVATLTGDVTTWTARQAATQVAALTPGVCDVDDRLSVTTGEG